MKFIKSTTIRIVASLLTILFFACTPAIASELLDDLKQRADETCRRAIDSNNEEQRRLCREYNAMYENEKNSQFRKPDFETWTVRCEKRYLSQGIYGGCVCFQGVDDQYNNDLTYPRERVVDYRVGAYSSPLMILGDCEYWICKYDTTSDERCSQYTSLIEYTRNAELVTNDSSTISSVGFPGRWDTGAFGILQIDKSGKGHYSYKNGKINGSWNDKTFKGTWSQDNASGYFEFELSKNGDSFKGKWMTIDGSAWHYDWNGRRQK